MFLEPKRKREMFMSLVMLYRLLKDAFCCKNMIRLRIILMPLLRSLWLGWDEN